MTFGTFDHFHAGHEYYLKNAKKLGDLLITIIARDITVKKVKGDLPDNNESQRKKTVEESKIPNKVVLGSTENVYDVIKKYKPDVICLGYDQYAFTQTLQKFLIDNKLNTEVVRLKPYQPKKFKSSLIKANAK